MTDPHADVPVLYAGAPLGEATFALILTHGRGGSAEGMLPIARNAGAMDAALIAPRARDASWYPHRFLDPFAMNEPSLSSALRVMDHGVREAMQAGIPAERIVLVGFSQGTCLSLEYAARHGRRFGGIAALAGALMGDDADMRPVHRPVHPAASGALAGTPVLLACGDDDVHIPEARVRQTASWLTAQGAEVDLRIYPGLGHSIVGDQLTALRAMVDRVRTPEAHVAAPTTPSAAPPSAI